MTHQQLQTIDADTLLSTTLPPTRFIIDRLLPQGLHILAGAPKVGKSWLALWLCLQVAQGTSVWDFPTHRGTVLYLCLEDSLTRIQSRLFQIADDAPEALHFATIAACIGQGLEVQLTNFLAQHPDTSLVVMMPAVGFAIGCFLAGILADRVFHSKKKVLVMGTIVYTAVWAVIAFTQIDSAMVQMAIRV